MPEHANHSDLNFRRHLGGLLAQSKDVTRIAAAVAAVTTVVREPVVIQTLAAVMRTEEEVIDCHLYVSHGKTIVGLRSESFEYRKGLYVV